MRRRLVAAAVFVAFPLAAILTVSQPRVTAQQPSAPVRPAIPALRPCPPSCPILLRPPARRARSDRRRLHRLLPVRLRRLDREEPGAGGPRQLGTLRGAAGAQQRDAAHDPRRPQRPAGDQASKKIGDYYASCMDETAIDAKGSGPLDPLLKKIAALSSVNDLAPLVAELHTIGVDVFFQFGSQADFKDATMRWRSSTRAASACRIATTTSSDDAKSVELRTQYVEHVGPDVGDCWARATSRKAAPPAQEVDGRSRRRWPRARSTPSRAAIRTRSTTGCRTPSCRR